MKRLRVEDEIKDYLVREDTKDHLDGSTLVLYMPVIHADPQGNYPPKWLLRDARQTFTDALNGMEDTEWHTRLRVGGTISAGDLKLRNVALVPKSVIGRGSMSTSEFDAYMQTEVRYEMVSKKARPEESSVEAISISSHSSNDDDDSDDDDDSEEDDSDDDDDDDDDDEEESDSDDDSDEESDSDDDSDEDDE